MGSLDLLPETFFRATPSRKRLLGKWYKSYFTIDICSESENLSFNLETKYKEVTTTLAFAVVSSKTRNKISRYCPERKIVYAGRNDSEARGSNRSKRAPTCMSTSLGHHLA